MINFQNVCDSELDCCEFLLTFLNTYNEQMVPTREDDIAVKLDAARRRNARLLKQRGDLSTQVELLKEEQTTAENRESAALMRLSQLESELLNEIFAASATIRSVAAFKGLGSLLDQYVQDEAALYRKLNEDVEDARNSCGDLEERLTAMTAELKQCAEKNMQWAQYEQSAQEERMELMRLRQETIDIEGRNDTAALKYARELFGVR
jgi:hypothetical protein